MTVYTKDTITLICQLIHNYFKGVLIPYKTAILLKYNSKELLIHFACYIHSFIQ